MDGRELAIMVMLIIAAELAVGLIQRMIEPINPNSGIINYPQKAGGCPHCGK